MGDVTRIDPGQDRYARSASGNGGQQTVVDSSTRGRIRFSSRSNDAAGHQHRNFHGPPEARHRACRGCGRCHRSRPMGEKPCQKTEPQANRRAARQKVPRRAEVMEIAQIGDLTRIDLGKGEITTRSTHEQGSAVLSAGACHHCNGIADGDGSGQLQPVALHVGVGRSIPTHDKGWHRHRQRSSRLQRQRQ